MDQESFMGIAGLFIIWTINMVVFMFSSFKTYTKVTRWFYDDLIEDGKKNGWDFKRVILPLIARNIPAIFVLGSLAGEDFFATLICYIAYSLAIKGLETMLKGKQAG